MMSSSRLIRVILWSVLSSVAVFALAYLLVGPSESAPFPRTLVRHFREVTDPSIEVDAEQALEMPTTGELAILSLKTEVRIEPSTDGSAHLSLRGRWPQSDKEHIQVRRTNGEVLIATKEHDHADWLSFYPDDRSAGHLVLKIPKGYSARVRVNSVAGSVDIEGVNLTSVVAKTTAGRVTVKASESHVIEIQTLSGDVAVDALTDHVEIATGSGDVEARVRGLERVRDARLHVSTLSGDVVFSVSDQASLAVNLESLNGDVHSEFETRDGARGTEVLLGAGSGTLEIESVSGEIRLTRYE